MAWFSFTNLTRNTLARAESVNTIFQAILDAFTAYLPVNTDLFKQHRLNYAADTGAANAYVVALDPAPTAYVIGLAVDMVTANANTTASTINVNGLGVKNIVQSDGSALTAGQIIANAVMSMRYDGTSFRLNAAVVTTAPTAGTVDVGSLAASIYASQAEAEAAVENTKLMTPLRVLQTMNAKISSFMYTLLDDANLATLWGTIGGTVNIDGGAIDGTPIGTTTPAGGRFTTLESSGAANLASLTGAGKPPTEQRFTASGTYTKPAGLVCALVEVWGPGGSGAGATGAASNSSWGSGGGAGEYSRRFLLAASIASSETVTVGTGGAAPAAADPANNGNAGSGNSSFGTLCTAGAGGGGVRQTSGTGLAATLGGTGGSGGTGGDIMISGEHGGTSIRLSGTGGVSGRGGGRGGGAATNVLGAGGAGDIGAGGGGAGSTGTSQQVGGVGGNGLVIVTEFY